MTWYTNQTYLIASLPEESSPIAALILGVARAIVDLQLKYVLEFSQQISVHV